MWGKYDAAVNHINIFHFVFDSMAVQEGYMGHHFSSLTDLHYRTVARLSTTRNGEASLIHWWKKAKHKGNWHLFLTSAQQLKYSSLKQKYVFYLSGI